jgi:hypothetical protein
MHYKVQFTADQEYMALLEEARDLLAHVNPTRDFVEVQRRALEVLVMQLRKRKHAARASAAPEGAEVRAPACGNHRADEQRASFATSTEPAASKYTRRPSAAVARTVWQRDQGRCTYVDDRGQRCRETSMLEYHHEQAWALGGVTTVSNLALRCRAHNALAAEEEFGEPTPGPFERKRHESTKLATFHNASSDALTNLNRSAGIRPTRSKASRRSCLCSL